MAPLALLAVPKSRSASYRTARTPSSKSIAAAELPASWSRGGAFYMYTSPHLHRRYTSYYDRRYATERVPRRRCHTSLGFHTYISAHRSPITTSEPLSAGDRSSPRFGRLGEAVNRMTPSLAHRRAQLLRRPLSQSRCTLGGRADGALMPEWDSYANSNRTVVSLCGSRRCLGSQLTLLAS